MKLKVFLPTRVLVDQEVDKVTVEAENGSFTMLPRHIDFVSSLVPGLLSFYHEGGEELISLDEGIVVKVGADVMVSTGNAVRGRNLGQLRQTVEEKFRTMDEKERKSRSVLAKFESEFIRRFLELERR